MTDTLNENGLSVKTVDQLVSDLETGFRNIYGDDINIASNSPDGQMINLIAQAGGDIRELLVSVNNSFSRSRAQGRLLDERVELNNVIRAAGTFTNVPITITVDRTVNLQGLDAAASDVNGTGYTIADDAGNNFILIDSQTLVAGTHVVNFRAERIGAVQVTTNTITNFVTIVLGVTSVNNPSGVLQTGSEEETDAQLRLRSQRSVAITSNGNLNGLRGALLALDGVTEALVLENFTNVTDSDGIPGHSIWVIVEGGANSEIGETIANRKTAGAGMRGAQVVNVPLQGGSTFVARFDRPLAADLHIQFDIQPFEAGTLFDEAAIKQYIVDNLTYSLNQAADTSMVTCVAVAAINANGGGGAPVNVEISSDGSTFVDYLPAPTKQTQWTLAVGNIDITVL